MKSTTPFLRLVFASATLLLLAGHASVYAQHVMVGSWNIENLGDRDFGQHPKALAQHIDLSGADVLALQELHDTNGAGAPYANSVLDEVLETLNELPGQDWTYEMFANRDASATARLAGIMWNQEVVSKTGETFRVPVEFGDSEEVWKRVPTAVKFSAGDGMTDFVVISLHMKSNSSGEGEYDPEDLRLMEADALAEQLDGVRTAHGDEDIILIGDTNCKEADEDAMQTYAGAGFTDLNSSDAVTYKKGQWASPFDRVLVPNGQNEFRYSRQYVLEPTDASDHYGRYSDHFLVKVAVRVLEDDD